MSKPAGGPGLTALDIEEPGALLLYLRTQGLIGPHEVPSIRTLAGGVSSRVVLVKRPVGAAWVLKQALPRLRVEVDWFSDPARVHREAMALNWLARLIPDSVPTLIFEDNDQHLLAMEAVPDPHRNWKEELLAGRVELELVVQFGRLLARVHRTAWTHLADMADTFRDRSVFESLRIEPYFLYTGRQVPEAGPFLDALVEETRAHTVTLVHGDFSPKNVLVHRGRLILLDHEVAHFGDPAFDIAFALTHLLSKAHHVKARREQFTSATHAFWQVYGEELADIDWRPSLEARSVRILLGCLLARVAGRSPLEYLTRAERGHQKAIVLGLTQSPPTSLPELFDEFTRSL